MADRWTQPHDWPIVAPGLLMTCIDDVMFVHIDRTIMPSVEELHLRELARAIDSRVNKMP